MKSISVCMATYNGEQYIKDQIDSILPQLGASDELIVSDDSSTDRTLEIVESYGDTRIRILKGRKFASPILNFENALKHAKGDYIFLSDQDDVWGPGRVSQILDKFIDHDLIVCDCKIVDQNLNVLQPSYFSIVNAKSGFFRNLLKTSPFIGCCMAFNRKVLSLALPFPSGIPMHDFWIAMLAEARFKVLLFDKPLVLYRRHGANASFTGSASKYSLLKKMQFRIGLLSSLIPRLLFSRV
ncbi:glycosyltransferase family 2 protein [Chryseolinea sp. T2]|uniref:glycosyltransferase family 2 protein n=1 Tax=Chryseolinea sp. T2 TaxID=3129255 RepID=UPI003077416D